MPGVEVKSGEIFTFSRYARINIRIMIGFRSEEALTHLSYNKVHESQSKRGK